MSAFAIVSTLLSVSLSLSFMITSQLIVLDSSFHLAHIGSGLMAFLSTLFTFYAINVEKYCPNKEVSTSLFEPTPPKRMPTLSSWEDSLFHSTMTNYNLYLPGSPSPAPQFHADEMIPFRGTPFPLTMNLTRSFSEEEEIDAGYDGELEEDSMSEKMKRAYCGIVA